jgi:hypothetical protein
MRELEELARDIDRFTLESAIRREVKNADGSITIKREAVPSDKGIPALREHIRANWTIDEVLFFKHFTHCGTFTPRGGGWYIEYPGYIASTAEGMNNLVALFNKLHAEAWAFMGARLCANMKSGTPKAALLCDSHELCSLTLCALVNQLPEPFADALGEIRAGIAFLAGEKKGLEDRRSKAGKKAAKARAEAEEGAEEKPYKERIKEALEQVAARVKSGEQDLAACRHVCKHYGEKVNPRTGEVEVKGGLHKMNGDPMPPGTLRDYFRKRRKRK